MKTVAEIEAFWNALPGAGVFASHFDRAVEAIARAAQDAQRAEAAALASKVRHKHAIAALRERVEAAATTDWSPAEIDTARRAALRQAFVIAGGGPPARNHQLSGTADWCSIKAPTIQTYESIVSNI